MIIDVNDDVMDDVRDKKKPLGRKTNWIAFQSSHVWRTTVCPLLNGVPVSSVY